MRLCGHRRNFRFSNRGGVALGGRLSTQPSGKSRQQRACLTRKNEACRAQRALYFGDAAFQNSGNLLNWPPTIVFPDEYLLLVFRKMGQCFQDGESHLFANLGLHHLSNGNHSVLLHFARAITEPRASDHAYIDEKSSQKLHLSREGKQKCLRCVVDLCVGTSPGKILLSSLASVLMVPLGLGISITRMRTTASGRGPAYERNPLSSPFSFQIGQIFGKERWTLQEAGSTRHLTGR